MAATSLDLEFTAGDDETFVFTFFDDEDLDEPSDLSDRSYRAQVKKRRNSTEAADATGSVTIDANKITVKFDKVSTRALRNGGRRYFWDLEETAPSGETATLFIGTVTIKDDVTR